LRYYFALLIGLIVTISGQGQPRERFELLSETLITGPYIDFVIEGRVLYAASGYGVEILDISDPNDPQLLSRISTAGNAIKLAIYEGFIYVSDNLRGIHAFDVRDLNNIRRTWTIHEVDGDIVHCLDLKIHENRLYACVWSEGVMVFDLSQPARPQHLGTYHSAPYPNGIEFHNGIAFIIDTAWDAYIVADLRNPENMFTYNGAGRQVPGNLTDIFIHNDLLLISHSEVGVTIFDIEDPLEPDRLQSIIIEGTALQIIAEGNYAYASCGSGGLQTIDISNPDSAGIVNVDDVTLPYVNCFILGSNSRAFAGGEQGGLATFRLVNPIVPYLLNLYSTPSLVQSLAMIGHIAYVARGQEGVMILDLSDPRNPQVESEIDSLYVTDVMIDEDWLYLTTYNPQNENYYFQTWYLRDPLDPEAVWIHALEGELLGVKVWDELLYLHINPDQIEIWEISDPDFPDLITVLNDLEFHTFNVREDYLYGIDSDNRLRIIGLQNLEDPDLLGSSRQMHIGNSITINGSNAFVADGNRGVAIFDITNPIRITEIDQFDTHYKARNIYVMGSKLWVCDNFGGIQVNHNDPESGYPQMGFTDTYGNADMAVIVDDIAYIADNYSLAICRFDSALSVNVGRNYLSENFDLLYVYPNPFNGYLRFDFRLTERSDVVLSIYNLQGREVQHWKWGGLETGSHTVHWDVDSGKSGIMGSGIYFCQLSSGDRVETRKVLLIR